MDTSQKHFLMLNKKLWTASFFIQQTYFYFYFYDGTYGPPYALESWFTNLEQTPLNRCLQLPAPYKRLIDSINETDKQ